MMNIPYSTVFFTSYETLKKAVGGEQSESVALHLSCGAAAGERKELKKKKKKKFNCCRCYRGCDYKSFGCCKDSPADSARVWEEI